MLQEKKVAKMGDGDGKSRVGTRLEILKKKQMEMQYATDTKNLTNKNFMLMFWKNK